MSGSQSASTSATTGADDARGMDVKDSILDCVGNTPLVRIRNLTRGIRTPVYAKIESMNPGGSVKDRIALSMIEQAEKDGLLAPGITLIEPSSGNTGIGMALVCSLKGYRLKIVLPENVSIERRQMLEVFGAEIISSPGSEGSNGAVKLAQHLAVENPDWVFLYQYGNQANPQAHFSGTGPEIFRDVPEITHFIAGLGTSGTLIGVGSYLKSVKPSCALPPLPRVQPSAQPTVPRQPALLNASFPAGLA